MLTIIKDKFTAAWKAHFAAVGTVIVTYLLSIFGLAPEPDGESIQLAKSGIGEIVFSLVSGFGAWIFTYFSPKNTETTPETKG